MHVFQIKGLSGLLMFLLMTTLALLASFVLPAAFMMTLWNATVFEIFQGPEIGFLQGIILWVGSLITFKLIFKPDISLELHQVNYPEDMDKHQKDS